MIKQAWDYKSEVANNNKQGSLSKGKKFLSEYYYIDLDKMTMEKGEDCGYVLEALLNLHGFDLGREIIEKAPYLNTGNIYGETGNVIVKQKLEPYSIYTHDSIDPLGSGAAGVNIAIRKYVALNVLGSGQALVGFGMMYINTITMAAMALGNYTQSIEEVKLIEKQITELIQPYLITEEEFWDDIQLVDSIDGLQDLLPNT